MNNKKLAANTYFLLLLFHFSINQATAEMWDFSHQSIDIGYGYEKRSEVPELVGQKLILDTQLSLLNAPDQVSDELKNCAKPSLPENFYGLIDLHLRWGTNGTGLQYTNINITPLATMYLPESVPEQGMHTQWDLLELAATRYIKDDALEVDSYIEVSILRAGRMGAYQWSEASDFKFLAGMQASAGWAWAESNNQTYSKVSNPFAGVFFNLSVEHQRWGKIYSEQRFVNGFSFSSPARGHPSVREANVRLGYYKQIASCFAFDAYIAKRSFYFDEGSLPALYTQTGTVAAEISCNW